MNYNKLIPYINYTFYYELMNNIINNIIQRFYITYFYIKKTKLLIFSSILKYNSLLQFNFLMDGSSLDFIDKKKRFSLKYFFLSTFFNLRLVITLKVKEFSFISSLKNLYYNAKAIEREL